MIRHRDLGGLRLREGGSETGPPVLWLHGLGESSLGLQATISRPELADWHHWVPDLPGYGCSLPRRPEPALDDVAEQLGEWLEVLDRGPVVVIGHSMGGVLGILLAERRPDHVRGFVNVEGNVSAADCTLSARAAAWSREEFLERGFCRLSEEVFVEARDVVALRRYLPSLCFADPATYHLHSLELVERSAREELAERQARLGLPTIYLWGDPGGTGSHSRALLERAGIALRAVEGAGHWPFVDRPDAFVAILREVLLGLG